MLFLIIAINSLVTMIWERVIVSYIALAWKKRRDQGFRNNLNNKELTL